MTNATRTRSRRRMPSAEDDYADKLLYRPDGAITNELNEQSDLFGQLRSPVIFGADSET